MTHLLPSRRALTSAALAAALLLPSVSSSSHYAGATLSAGAAKHESASASVAAPLRNARQARVFAKLWQLVNDTYVYPSFNGVDWKAKKAEVEARIAAGMDDAEFYRTMRGLIASLNDQHSAYLPPYVAEEFFEVFISAGDYEGIGLITEMNRERRYLYVVQVIPGSSAEKAGIRPHDRILQIGGYPTVDRDGYSQSFLMLGPAGSEVPITVQSPSGETRSFNIVRERIPNTELVDQRLLPNAAGKKIGYLLIPTFFSGTIDKQAQRSLATLMASAGGKLDGLVIDVRTNGGGSVTTLGNILGLFTKGPLGKFSSRKGAAGGITARGINIGNSQSVPIVTLIGPDTASAAEIFAGALQFKKRSRLAGATSAGNIEGLRTHVLEDGSILFLAEVQFKLPNGFNWEGRGLQPDAAGPGAWDDITFDNDPAIQAALGLLQ